MSTEYPVTEFEGAELYVQTRSDGLDLRVDVKDCDCASTEVTDVISAKDMAKLGVRLCEIAMLNDHSMREDCCIDPVAFRKWVHGQIDEVLGAYCKEPPLNTYPTCPHGFVTAHRFEDVCADCRDAKIAERRGD